ncbi:respiratory chain complex I subunit 1 family protein [Falsiroseomonas stagni]|uniref:Formate hydrogenlyase subunit 4 n=1 Tax=Falsiroseomonas stagni DSM 19981 TaxID=1123062 RepID=A0A1I4AAL3_9PROT|nr:NADH-quinone oxidoreductase subunit H [Falsiroseomonas stagni]SFK53353.1 Formate hydrogenlyase subunit 4 [Falsiroseomonas stagni DSM 19981]
MTAVMGVLTQAIHLALLLVAAPLVVGVVRWLKARMMGRVGASPLQPLRDFLKLLRKRPVLAENASWISRGAPYVGAAAALAAAALVPSFAHGMALAGLGDLIVIAGLLALGRVCMALAGLDVGTAFGGLGASREMSFAALAEPALLLAVMSFAILAGTTGLDAIAMTFQEGTLGLRVSLGLALVALLAVAVAENARIPVDNPATHLELTMVHEAMILEASGRHLALWDAAAAMRLTLWFALLAAIFFPFGTAAPGWAPLGWVVGLLAWIAKMGVLCLALAVFESAIAKMRVFRVPEFLGAALLLGLLGALLLFVSTSLA